MNFDKKKIEVITFFVIILLTIVLYSDLFNSLPLFGDATIHGFSTREIVRYGVLSTSDLNYPPLYFVTQSLIFNFVGEKYIKYIVLFGLLLIGSFSYLLSKKVLKSIPIAFLSMILVLFSPKILYYSTRMYIEVYLSGFFLVVIYFFSQFNKDRKNYTFLLILLLSTTMLIKQQALFIIYPALIITSFFFLRRKLKKKFFYLILIPIIISAPGYLLLFHTDGEALPGLEEFTFGKKINWLGQSIFGFKNDDINYSVDIKNRFDEIEIDKYGTGSQRAEDRHIWPWDPFISLERFIEVNSLYLVKFDKNKENYFIPFLNSLMFFGYFIFLILISHKENVKLRFLAVFLIIFLAINYSLFMRNTDQIRYHLFLPISLFFLTMYPLKFYLQKYNKTFLIILVLIFLISSIYFVENLVDNKRWKNSQIYSPSKGGIKSLEEVGSWLKNNSQISNPIWSNCGNEIAYYSDRKNVGDYKFYFLNDSELKFAVESTNASFLVLLDSQIFQDNKWNNFCFIPLSFSERVKKIYPEVYRSSYDDISVYKITLQNKTNTTTQTLKNATT